MIYFTGDINLTDWYFNQGFGIGTSIERGSDPFQYFNRNNEDLWVGNFEGVASSVSDKKELNAKVFRVEQTTIKKLKHFDVYGFANNLSMQHGKGGYQQTVDTLLECGCNVFGTNENKSHVLEYHGKQVSITGVNFRVDEFSSNPSYWYNPEYKEIEK